jgi:glycosyltransferase involved in cell wall biosynthesis
LRVPAGVTWELLVVNNNCTDDTDAVAARHGDALPLRLLHETKQGLSNARNCAIEHTRGDLLVWTDDDVLVEPDWLTEYLAAETAFPDAGFFGGTVDPWFAVEPPAWVRRNLDQLQGPFAIRQLGPGVRPLAANEIPFGANMAFRTALIRGHRFDPALGRIGTGMLSGEEAELVARLRKQGHPGVWVGTARVRHYIAADRMTAAYVWKFFHGLGRTKQRVAPHDRGVPLLRRAPRWVVREYLVERAKSLVLAPGRGTAWVRSFTRAAVARGVIDECRATRAGA